MMNSIFSSTVYLTKAAEYGFAAMRKNNCCCIACCPDGKTQVSIRYENDVAVFADTVLVSTQHNPDVSQEQIREDIIREVITPVISEKLLRQHRIYRDEEKAHPSLKLKAQRYV